MKKFKKRHHKKLKNTPPKIGDEVVTETVVVYSHATVVWQDGSIEANIPSRQLYPIHHLDEHVCVYRTASILVLFVIFVSFF